MFVATLFTIVSRWKKLKYLSAREWAEKWYVDIMEHYSAMQRNKQRHAGTPGAFCSVKEIRPKRPHDQPLHSHGILEEVSTQGQKTDW